MIQKEGKGSRFAVVWCVLSLLNVCCEVRRQVCQQEGDLRKTPPVTWLLQPEVRDCGQAQGCEMNP